MCIPTKIFQGIKPMGLCNPWYESYLHKSIKSQNIYHQKLMNLLLTIVMCTQKQFRTITKLTVPCDVYKSIYVDYTSYSTDKTNVYNN